MRTITEMVESHLYRLIDSKIEFLVLKRAKNETYPGLWQPITGRIDKPEKAFQTAFREIKEETGIRPISLRVVPNVNMFYSQYGDYISLIPVFMAEADSNSEVIISHEHSEFAWKSAEEAKLLFAWPGQRTSIEIIMEFLLNPNSNLIFANIDTRKL